VLFRRNKRLVGLDIGSSAIKAIELEPEGKGYRVAAIAVEPVPADSIVDGAIVDASAVTAAVRRIFTTRPFRGKKVAVALSGSSVIVKRISVLPVTDQDLSASIYWEAEQYIPFDIQDVTLDYEMSDPAFGSDNGHPNGSIDVLLVAAKKDKIADYTTVIRRAGRVPAILDVDAFALQNAYEVNYGFEARQVVVLLNVGASAINVNIVAGTQSVFARDVSMGGNAFTEAVQKELGLPFEAAEELKKGAHANAALFDNARPVLKAMTDSALLEVEKTFDFFKATTANDRIDRIVLSGGASRVEGFAEALEDRFDTTVERFNPFRQIDFDSKRLGASAEEMASLSAVAVGLALRQVGDR
jgi:type IV pilus assembly protein PilM